MIPPSANTAETHKVLRSIYQESPDYTEIISGSNALLSRMDGVLTSVGSVTVMSRWTGASLRNARGNHRGPLKS